MEDNKEYKNNEEDHYYSINTDPLSELAQDIIEETIFFREEDPITPPIPTIMDDVHSPLDIKVK